MKKVFLSLAIMATLSFTVAIGHAEKNTPVMEKIDLHAVSSNAP